jgi:hypothetical protein
MAYDEEVTNRVRTEVSGADVTERALSGGLACLVSGSVEFATTLPGQ